jgi:hypothetical protein
MKALLAILALLIIVGAGAFLFLRKPSAEPVPTPSENPFGNTGSGTVGGGDVPPGGIDISFSDGTRTSVPDFTKENQPAVAGPDTGFEAAGSAEGDYQVLYFPEDSYFLVTIFAEPIGENRARAESELRTRLGLTDAELCDLNADVFVTEDVNEFYSGADLGFSFCPGATALPQ